MEETVHLFYICALVAASVTAIIGIEWLLWTDRYMMTRKLGTKAITVLKVLLYLLAIVTTMAVMDFIGGDKGHGKGGIPVDGTQICCTKC